MANEIEKTAAEIAALKAAALEDLESEGLDRSRRENEEANKDFIDDSWVDHQQEKMKAHGGFDVEAEVANVMAGMFPHARHRIFAQVSRHGLENKDMNTLDEGITMSQFGLSTSTEPCREAHTIPEQFVGGVPSNMFPIMINWESKCISQTYLVSPAQDLSQVFERFRVFTLSTNAFRYFFMNRDVTDNEVKTPESLGLKPGATLHAFTETDMKKEVDFTDALDGDERENDDDDEEESASLTGDRKPDEKQDNSQQQDRGTNSDNKQDHDGGETHPAPTPTEETSSDPQENGDKTNVEATGNKPSEIPSKDKEASAGAPRGGCNKKGKDSDDGKGDSSNDGKDEADSNESKPKKLTITIKTEENRQPFVCKLTTPLRRLFRAFFDNQDTFKSLDSVHFWTNGRLLRNYEATCAEANLRDGSIIHAYKVDSGEEDTSSSDSSSDGEGQFPSEDSDFVDDEEAEVEITLSIILNRKTTVAIDLQVPPDHSLVHVANKTLEKKYPNKRFVFAYCGTALSGKETPHSLEMEPSIIHTVVAVAIKKSAAVVTKKKPAPRTQAAKTKRPLPTRGVHKRAAKKMQNPKKATAKARGGATKKAPVGGNKGRKKAAATATSSSSAEKRRSGKAGLKTTGLEEDTPSDLSYELSQRVLLAKPKRDFKQQPRLANEVPLDPRQQMDAHVRKRILGAQLNIQTAQRMSLPRSRSDVAPPQRYPIDEDEQASYEETWPWVIVTTGIFSEQHTNDDGNNEEGKIFLNKPKYHVLVGSEMAAEKMKETFSEVTKFDLVCHTSFETYRLAMGCMKEQKGGEKKRVTRGEKKEEEYLKKRKRAKVDHLKKRKRAKVD